MYKRQALYDAFHQIIPVSKNSAKSKGKIEFVGPICESTCKFGIYKNYQKINENDFIAITNVGAYGSSLSSNSIKESSTWLRLSVASSQKSDTSDVLSAGIFNSSGESSICARGSIAEGVL